MNRLVILGAKFDEISIEKIYFEPKQYYETVIHMLLLVECLSTKASFWN